MEKEMKYKMIEAKTVGSMQELLNHEYDKGYIRATEIFTYPNKQSQPHQICFYCLLEKVQKSSTKEVKEKVQNETTTIASSR